MVTRSSTRIIVLSIATSLSGCGLFGFDEDVQTDGAVCSSNDDCSTGVCTSASLCSHSLCDCPSGDCLDGGELTSDCLDGWVCVGYDSILDPVEEFFGGTPDTSDGFCQPSCADGCPDHYSCAADGQTCSPDFAWAAPQPTISWTGPVTGELSGAGEMLTVSISPGSTVSLTGAAESPTGAAILAMSWTTVSAAGDYVQFEGPTLETTIPSDEGDYRRVELVVSDDRARSSQITVIFESHMQP